QGLLTDGPNVLATHALNRSAADSDFLVVPELTMVRFGEPIVPAEPIVLQARTWRDGQWSAPAAGPQNDILINEILARSGATDPDRIELFNTTDRPIELSGWLFTDDLTDVGRYLVPAGTTIDAGGYLSLSSTETGFQMDGQQGGQVWLVQPAAEARAMRFVDTVRFDGSAPGVSLGRWPNVDRLSPLFPMTSQTFGEENSGPALGDVIVSEVDYQPRLPASVPSITGDYELEFVELFGRSSTPVNLNGWQIDGGVLFTFTEDIELSEGQTVVLVGFDPAEAARADAFRQVLEIDPSVRLVGPYVGRLANGGEQLRLLKPLVGVDPQQGVALVDSLAYDNQTPWPTKAAGGGLSLHRTAEDAFGGFVSSFRPLKPSPGEELFIMAGDLDLNGTVDAGDVAGFVQALTDPAAYEAAFGVSVLHGGDLDHDGDVDYDDIQGLVDQLAAATAAGTERVGVVAARDHGLVSGRRSPKQRHGPQDDLTGKPRHAHWATLADRVLETESIWRNGE
ncbi:MAG: lamin tail domain-containing protein, partial [Pirellulales bacterium]